MARYNSLVSMTNSNEKTSAAQILDGNFPWSALIGMVYSGYLIYRLFYAASRLHTEYLCMHLRGCEWTLHVMVVIMRGDGWGTAGGLLIPV